MLCYLELMWETSNQNICHVDLRLTVSKYKIFSYTLHRVNSEYPQIAVKRYFVHSFFISIHPFWTWGPMLVNLNLGNGLVMLKKKASHFLYVPQEKKFFFGKSLVLSIMKILKRKWFLFLLAEIRTMVLVTNRNES